jgi:hypothetical protein|tara:strand:+ start:375 stop:569 length:195 start_codon:yes stop_codon:yes gene_type:complete
MERYLITTESYVYAENDQKAKSLAGYIQGKQRKMYDNQHCVTRLEFAPFGAGFSDKNLIEGEIL